MDFIMGGLFGVAVALLVEALVNSIREPGPMDSDVDLAYRKGFAEGMEFEKRLLEEEKKRKADQK